MAPAGGTSNAAARSDGESRIRYGRLLAIKPQVHAHEHNTYTKATKCNLEESPSFLGNWADTSFPNEIKASSRKSPKTSIMIRKELLLDTIFRNLAASEHAAILWVRIYV
jgi:hypothetical protein